MRSRTRQALGQSLIPVFLAACLLLGGASAAGYAANMLLQLGAVVILYVALLVHPDVAIPPAGRQLLGLLALLLLLFAIQLVPLPPTLWTALPGRAPVAAGYRLLGQPLPWLPVSLAPTKALASLLWLLPAFAALTGTLRIGAYRAPAVAWLLAGFAVVSVGLGALQLAGGPNSPAYFYNFTNFGVAVGFFSNANHLGTLMLVTIPFLGALLAGTVGSQRDRKRASAGIMAVAAVALVIIVGIAITGSLAAIGLALPVIAATALMIRADRARAAPRWALPVIVLLALVALGVVMSRPFGNNLTGKDAGTDLSRATSYAKTLAATPDYLPVGSGIGSFVDIYRERENPAKVTDTYMNHAHSDLLEIVLETGVPGGLLLGLFLLWWVRRTLAIWSGGDHDLYARAATVASAAIMAHSLVDYPLRTAAISAVFAFCLALMAGARERSVGRERERDGAARHLSA